MAVEVIGKVFNACGLHPTQKLILLRLADSANPDGTKAYPSVARMAAECSVSVRTIQYALRQLEQDGFIRCVDHQRGGRSNTRVYDIDLERVQELHTFEDIKDAIDCTVSDQKGATDDTKGCNPLHPNRPLPVLLPSLLRSEGPPGGQEPNFGKRLFGENLNFLISHACLENKKARTLLGRWLKVTGDDHRAVSELLTQAASRDPPIADLVPWVEARLRPSETDDMNATLDRLMQT